MMIHETIVTTVGVDQQAHIAPFGIREEGGRVLIAPFRPSASLDNLLANRCAVINLTDDVRIFAGALTGRRSWPVTRAQRINGYVLDAALAHRELELVEVKDDPQRPELFFKVVHEANHRPFKGFNRAQSAVIELAVLVSRLNRLPMQKVDAELAYLDIAIQKTAGPRELEAWGWLLEAVERHRAQLTGDHQA